MFLTRRLYLKSNESHLLSTILRKIARILFRFAKEKEGKKVIIDKLQ